MTIDHELEVSKVKDGRDELAGLSDVTFRETSVLQGMFEVLESKGVVVPSVVPKVPGSLTEVTVSGLVSQMKVLALLNGSTGDEVIEDVKIPFSRWGCRNPVSFEVVIQGLDSA